MLPSNPIPAVCNYGSSATYCTCPTDEQIAAGVVPLDSLPAAWWNWMWSKTNQSLNCARFTVGTLISELNTVLAQAGVQACDECVDQLYQSITKLRRIVGDADYPGAVKSSSTPGQVSIDEHGVMTANCVGNASQLTTTAHTLVGAVNELKTTYDTNFSNVNTALGGKAPTSHASSANTYGVGSAANYGHLKISDQYTSVLAACSGVAASQQALVCVYCYAAGIAADALGLGNTAGCGLGTASAGTATTAARSDHVHPMPSRTDLGLGTAAACAATAFLGASGCAVDSAKLTGKTPSTLCVACAGQAYCVMDYYNNASPLYIGYACTGLTCAQITHLAAFSTNYTSGKTVIKDVCKANVQLWLGLGTAAACAATAFLGASGCAVDSAKLTGKTPSTLCVACAGANGSGTAFGTAATKTAGSAAGNVPLVATGGLEGTTYGRLVAATQGGYLFSTSYTTASFLGATAEACCAVRAKCVDNRQTGASTIGDIYLCTNCTSAGGLQSVHTFVMCGANGFFYGDVCGNVCGTATSAVTASVATSAGSATYATSACCAKCIYPEVANALCTPNSSSICNKCSFAVLAFNSCNGCVIYLPSKRCMNTSNPSCFGTTALRVI